ncbi:pyrophosphohydrolase domain-containing protein [Paenibacillus alba]|uniref:HAD family hydrolase n=1 Tax=Paenibacillus alba TaxID=1197127 RepID=A0ABU6FXI6_9BACL|nr:HAD family hydrolase [Paenibacillus alba]MEC0226623.1 HAD family hydrolase [Paenibacillus alba]NQX67840.1 HAD family hydrolase [Paenibacillus alba]
MTLKNAYEDIKKFHEAFQHPIGTSPQRLSESRKAARMAWMQEELNEYKEAATLEDEVDAMIDELYFVLGTLVEMGVEPGPIFDIVHHANMSKVWPDGLVHKNEFGKTIKPPDWQDPFDKISAEIRRQQNK